MNRLRDRFQDIPAELRKMEACTPAATSPQAGDVEVTDCTGVIKGNADIVCERGTASRPVTPPPLPGYPPRGGIEL